MFKKANPRLIWFTSTTIVIILLVALGWQIVNFVAFYGVGKNLQRVCSPVPYYFLAKDFDRAEQSLKVCHDKIGEAKARLEKINNITLGALNGSIKPFNEFLSALDNILADGSQLAQLAGRWSEDSSIETNLWEFVLNNFSEISKLNDRIQDHQQELTRSLDHNFSIFKYLQKKFSVSVALAAQANALISEITPYSELLGWSLGFDQPKTFLVFFQNISELRPTGGFWGSYGILKIQDGEIVSLSTDDIYHLDVNLIGLEQIPAPPEPLKKYLAVNEWFLRDANWSPNFPDSAVFGQSLYNLAGGQEQIDGVIAITPQLVEELLAFLGPITIDGHTYNRENFLTDLQYEVEQGYQDKDIPSWNRKDILQAIVDSLLAELPTTLNEVRALEPIIKTIDSNLERKNILIYANDALVQQKLVSNNWAGALNPSFEDYLMVVDANLASFKSDLFVERKISYQIEPELADDINSPLIATVKINYFHRGNFDWKTTRYRTYSRVYVPEGSQLISAEGAMENDRSSVPGQVDIYAEYGKTVFGAFIAVEPQQGGSLVFKYKLPERIAEKMRLGSYHLLLQKQPGVINQTFKLELTGYQPVKKVYWLRSNDFIISHQLLINEFSLLKDNHLIVNY